MKFRATVHTTGKTAAGIPIPDEVIEGLGAGRRPPVRVTINGHTYRTSIGTVDGRAMVSFSVENRLKAGVAGGETVDIDIQVDTQKREVTLSPDFAEALDREPEARRFFDSLTYSVQQVHTLSVEGAKTPETRQRRIEKSVAMLREGRAR
jgi:Bacteriocin-protection, YdeI or OmpD-Associated/Domain of unknown function (DUF1905)